MKFQTIELKGYKRFALNNIKLLRLDMSEVMQVILGRNGCGKSSLLKELTPLPAEAKHFSKDGHKILICKHGQDVYTLTSKFAPVTKHSFIKNSEVELNEGGTAAVQKDLARQIFGVTSDFIGVAMGTEVFTAMSPSRRRELFTQLCDTDYEYAIGVYNRAKVSLRDTSGAINVAKKRLAFETTNIVTDEQYTQLRDYLNELTQKSKELYQKKITQTPTRQKAISDASAVVSDIEKLAAVFWNARKTIIVNQCWSPSEIMQDIVEQRDNLHRENAMLSVLTEEHQLQKQRVGNNTTIDSEEVKILQEQAISLSDENKRLVNAFKTSIVPINTMEARLALDVVKDRLKDLLSTLPENSDGWYSAEILERQSDKLAVLKANYNKSIKFIETLNSAIVHCEHLLSKDAAQCPECSHSFQLGYDAKRHSQLVEKRQVGLTHVEKVQGEIAQLELLIKELIDYRDKFSQIKTIVSNTPILNCLWSEVFDINSLRMHPNSIATKIDMFAADLIIRTKILSNDQVMGVIKDKLGVVSAMAQKDFIAERDKLSAIEHSIDCCTARINNLNKGILFNQNYIKQVDVAQKIGERMQGLKQQLDKSIRIVDNAILNDLVDAVLTETHMEIATISTKVSDMTTRRALIADLKDQITKLEKDELAYKLLVSTFSPTDGIIAEGLLGFIRAYVKAMNATIAKIWTYKLKVLDCSTDEYSADLNYKFPVEVEGDPELREDVRDGSTAMTEVINLAYRLVAMVHMGLGDYPLMIDEFGSSFDAEHKARAPHAIKAISEQMNFEQIFIISHHQLEYTMFPTAQFCILDKNNISISSTMRYNEHVTML